MKTLIFISLFILPFVTAGAQDTTEVEFTDQNIENGIKEQEIQFAHYGGHDDDDDHHDCDDPDCDDSFHEGHDKNHTHTHLPPLYGITCRAGAFFCYMATSAPAGEDCSCTNVLGHTLFHGKVSIW